MSLARSARSIAVVSLSGAVGASVLARGGVDLPTQAAVLAATCAALATASLLGRERLHAPAPVLALAGAVAATALQLVPLPLALFGVLSAGASDIVQVVLVPLGLNAARPLSLDVPATAAELGKGAAVLAACSSAALLGGQARTRDGLLAVLSVAGVAAVVVAVGGGAWGGASALARGGPFVNPNHLAAFLSLAAWPALGHALRQRGLARAAWLLAFAVAGAGIFLTLSRAGIAAFFVGAGVFAALHVRREVLARAAGRGTAARWPRYAAAPAATALVLAIASYLALGRILEELRSVSTLARDPRMDIWAAAVSLMARHPLVGIGRGAFEVAFAGHHPGGPLSFTYTHAENEWLQLPIELGIPMGVAVVAALAWAWISAARRQDLSRVEIGALAGVAAVSVHSVFDFALELPGVAVPFAVALGAVSSGRGPSLRPIAFRIGALALAVAGAAGLAISAARPLDQTDRLGSAPLSEVPALARSLATWRPGDYLPHAAAGARLVEAGRCADAIPWLTRAMWLAPSVPDPHRYAGRCLAAARRGVFARREYRLAFMLGDGSALDEAVARFAGADELVQLVPETSEALVKLAELLERRGRGAEAAEVLERGWATLEDPDLLFRFGGIQVRTGDPMRAVETARRLRDAEPDHPRSYVLASLAMRELGDADGALRELEAGASRLPGSPELSLALGDELIHQRRFAQASHVLSRGGWRAGAHAERARDLLISALRAQGRLAEATAEARTARELDPRNLAVNLRLADVLAEAGLLEEATGVLSAALAIPGADPASISARLEKVRTRAATGGDRGSEGERPPR